MYYSSSLLIPELPRLSPDCKTDRIRFVFSLIIHSYACHKIFLISIKDQAEKMIKNYINKYLNKYNNSLNINADNECCASYFPYNEKNCGKIKNLWMGEVVCMYIGR